MSKIMLETLIGGIYVLTISCRKRLALIHSIILIAIISMLAFHICTINNELQQARQVTFYDADLQLTVGVYCLNNTVLYKVQDSIRQRNYPLQVFNDNAFYGKQPVRIHCDEMTFRTEDGQVLTHNEVLQNIISNIITGYLPYTASNTANFLDEKLSFTIP
ncbi:hypothetical protein [Pectobacterium sp. B2J-2]|uniref:hypothetical protein n=1 Tax=Pectobacterium sp. B2J-2 TaxID=3385372 RepID=UPI0038FBF6B3